jgi:hypothetical protein
VSTTSLKNVRLEEGVVTAVETASNFIELLDVHRTVSIGHARALHPGSLKGVHRLLLYEDGKPPIFVTVRRNVSGLWVKMDRAGGTTYPDDRLKGRLFPLECLNVLVSRWAMAMHEELDKEKKMRRTP